MAFRAFPFSAFPETYQQEILTKISGFLKEGESVQLIGAPGSGTSTLVRLVMQVPRIRRRYFANEDDYVFVALDANLLLERKSLTLTRLLLSLFGPGLDNLPEDNVVVSNKLVDKIGEICSKANLVVIIDHLQELDYPELKPFFATLSFVYNKYRPKISFLFVSQKPMIKRKDLENFGYLGKLLTANVVYVPILNKSDSLWFVNDIAKQENLRLSSELGRKVIETSGGYPRSMRRMVEALASGITIDELLVNPAVFPSLAYHLEELSEVSNLERSKILESYLRGAQSKSFGEKIENLGLEEKLTKLEKKLLSCLLANTENIVSREEGIESLWGENAVDASEHAYDQIVHRLRGKLERAIPKVKLETVRGRGHVLRYI